MAHLEHCHRHGVVFRLWSKLLHQASRQDASSQQALLCHIRLRPRGQAIEDISGWSPDATALLFSSMMGRYHPDMYTSVFASRVQPYSTKHSHGRFVLCLEALSIKVGSNEAALAARGDPQALSAAHIAGALSHTVEGVSQLLGLEACGHGSRLA